MLERLSVWVWSEHLLRGEACLLTLGGALLLTVELLVRSLSSCSEALSHFKQKALLVSANRASVVGKAASRTSAKAPKEI